MSDHSVACKATASRGTHETTSSAVGAALGILGALGLTRYLASLLYGVRPFDLLTFLSVALLLGLVALAACYIPARRASHVDPIMALRYE